MQDRRQRRGWSLRLKRRGWTKRMLWVLHQTRSQEKGESQQTTDTTATTADVHMELILSPSPHYTLLCITNDPMCTGLWGEKISRPDVPLHSLWYTWISEHLSLSFFPSSLILSLLSNSPTLVSCLVSWLRMPVSTTQIKAVFPSQTTKRISERVLTFATKGKFLW